MSTNEQEIYNYFTFSFGGGGGIVLLLSIC